MSVISNKNSEFSIFDETTMDDAKVKKTDSKILKN